MQADLRGFEYLAEPLRLQRQWRLEKLMTEMGSLQRDIAQVESHIERLRAEYRKLAQATAEATMRRFDVDTHRRGLHWLTALRRRLLESEASLEVLRLRQKTLRQACVAQQQQVDVIEAHREERAADYVKDQNGRLLAQADQDWNARTQRTVRGEA